MDKQKQKTVLTFAIEAIARTLPVEGKGHQLSRQIMMVLSDKQLMRKATDFAEKIHKDKKLEQDVLSKYGELLEKSRNLTQI